MANETGGGVYEQAHLLEGPKHSRGRGVGCLRVVLQDIMHQQQHVELLVGEVVEVPGARHRICFPRRRHIVFKI